MNTIFELNCLSFDLEIDPQTQRIFKIGALRGDDVQRSLLFAQGSLQQAVLRLDALAQGCQFLLGHNILAHDLPYLKAQFPDLMLHQLPVVDTLRLNPLAFPANPYHRLVKVYQDGKLCSGHKNNPLEDARLTLTLFQDQQQALADKAPTLLTAWHWLVCQPQMAGGMNGLFSQLRNQPRPDECSARQAIIACLDGQACFQQFEVILQEAQQNGWPLAYTLAWVSVAGSHSVMPPWVRLQFPAAAELVVRLRDTPCHQADCSWCSSKHDAVKQLKFWFGFDGFREEPVDLLSMKPLQQVIVEKSMAHQHVLGILPTGTGKSLCYQIPALSRFDKTGTLTVVISPLVALMADQVAGLEKRGINYSAALSGLLSMPERQEVLDKIRLGDVGILIVSPEQLRSSTFRHALAQREVGAWVLDEAHCLSKWGHAFRPDYRYVGRFIREKAAGNRIPPVLCLTATAKPEVISDIIQHFRDQLAIELVLLDGGAERKNLTLEVLTTDIASKYEHVFQLIKTHLSDEARDGAIVYCATKKQTEELAVFLQEKGLAARHFHAGLSPEVKKYTQSCFIEGELRVITATNAFGMGIDKPDVRLVIHADIPGSLENYLQEAGRAGRDQNPAHCVLLFTSEDVERQFSMSARTRLTHKEIQAILRALRNLDIKKRKQGKGGDVIATAGEILVEDDEQKFERDSATEDTRVRTAIAWLEEAQLLSREENRVQVFPSSLRVHSFEEAKQKLTQKDLTQDRKNQLLNIVETLLNARADEGVSTDDLMVVSGLASDALRGALYDLERLGIASNDTALTAYVHVGVERASKKRFEASCQLEVDLIAQLRENAPDLALGEAAPLYLRIVCQHLKDHGHPQLHPEILRRMLKGLSMDGRDNMEQGNKGSISLRKLDQDSCLLTLQRSWGKLARTAELRRQAAGLLLEHLIGQIPENTRGVDLLAETTLSKLQAAIDTDLVLSSELRSSQKCLDYALLWLHEQEIIRLNKGLAVFRPAMTIRLDDNWRKKFNQADFEPLKQHYQEQVIQIHVMAEYVQRGLVVMQDAIRLIHDYFKYSQAEFLRLWLPDRAEELQRQTTLKSWQAIVESLNDKGQRDIVVDEREITNVLVLAGPGSGKTRVLVHRIAYLIRVQRENPSGIVALAYNRHAAVQIRQRLYALIGQDSYGVTILTLHSLAMRLVGSSFAERSHQADEPDFDQLLHDATALLKGEGLLPEEADSLRDHLLGGFRWILVDEYQDINEAQYQLISALAGRALSDEDGKINLFAVGDDDQNIYSFQGASCEYIRRFERDYLAKPSYLIENYRSTNHIINACNQVIYYAAERMKIQHPIRINQARQEHAPGGEWQQLDPISQGRVQILPVSINPSNRAMDVMTELQRLASCDSSWNWSNCAVISRTWDNLQTVYNYCCWQHIPVMWASQHKLPFWRQRETQALLDWLKLHRLINASQLQQYLTEQSADFSLLRHAVNEYQQEMGSVERPCDHFKEWLAEWGRDIRSSQQGLLLVTAHSAKGLEFDHVLLMDGDWDKETDSDKQRRLYYVAMTRARKTLTLSVICRPHPLHSFTENAAYVLHREKPKSPPAPSCLRWQHWAVDLKQIDLGFAGRFSPYNTVHQKIKQLHIGSVLHLVQQGDRWELQDADNYTVGRMSQTFQMPEGKRCIEATVKMVVVWLASDDKTGKYKAPLCERWEVVVPEVVWG